MKEDSGLRFKNNDIVQSQGRLWRVADHSLAVKMRLVEIDSPTPETPVTQDIAVPENHPIFNRLNMQRLVPEFPDVER